VLRTVRPKNRESICCDLPRRHVTGRKVGEYVYLLVDFSNGEKIFGHQKNDKIGCWRIIHNYEICNLCRSSRIVREVDSRKM
jgi:hypothetical protein